MVKSLEVYFMKRKEEQETNDSSCLGLKIA